MHEEVFLYGLREERLAYEAVERRLRARQLGEAFEGLNEKGPDTVEALITECCERA